MLEHLAGQTIDHYQILRHVGESAQDVLFKAHDTNLDRDVALKVLQANLSQQPGFVEQFLQTGRLAAQLDHPGIAKVLDFGRSDSLLYIVTDFLAGANLEKLLGGIRSAGNWIALAEAVGIVRQLAQALDYAHGRGILFLDIPPRDIMFKPEAADGLPYRPVLTDLGLAPVDQSALTLREGQLPSEPAYASPEQARGEKTDVRSDVYSLGVLLFELATARLPFQVSTLAEAASYHSQVAVPAPRSLRPDLPVELEQVILRALEKNPADRYPTPAEFSDALAAVTPFAIEVDKLPGSLFPAVSLAAPYLQSLNEPEEVTLPTVPVLHPLTIETPMLQLSAAPGSAITVPMSVTNNGAEVDTVTVTVDGLPVEWLTAPPPVMQLLPGTQTHFDLIIQPTRSPFSRAGRYPVTVQAISHNAPEDIAEVKLTLTVTAFAHFTSDLALLSLLADQVGQVLITNEGNTPETFQVNWQSLSGELEFVPLQAQITVPEGQVGAVEFRAAPLSRPWIGTSRSNAYTVQVSASTGETQALSGEILSRPLLPVWVPALAVVLCCLLTAAAGMALRAGLSPEEVALTRTAAASQTAGALVGNDPDQDGLSNDEELLIGTDPNRADTDGDGLGDGDERTRGTNPLAVDTDGDTLTDSWEVRQSLTDPLKVDTDGDGLPDNTDPDAHVGPTFTPVATIGLPAPTNTFAPAAPTATNPPPPPPPPTAAPPADTAVPAPTNTGAPPAATNTQGAPPPGQTNGRVAFEARRDGNAEIYTVAPLDGQAQAARLTNAPGDDTVPVWSPDGTRIAFISMRDGNQEIYVMNADSSNQVRLTSNNAADFGLAWSPDSSQIAFISERDGNREVYVMQADGSAQTRATINTAEEADVTWSPAGGQIAFVTNRDGNRDVYVMNSNGSSQVRLTNGADDDFLPAWSPDGARIVYVSRQGANTELWIMNIDGTNKFQLTTNAAEDTNPVWSPGGQTLLFLTNRDGNTEIYGLNVQATLQGGALPVRLTDHGAPDTSPVWMPDGNAIVFVSERDGNSELYFMNLVCGDGTIGCPSPVIRLTNDAAPDTAPSLQPRS